MDALQEAYLAWTKLAPFTHKLPAEIRKLYFPLEYRIDTTKKFRDVGHYRTDGKIAVYPISFNGICCNNPTHTKNIAPPNSTIPQLVPVDDDDPRCCARELAWRKYCRIRDGKA